MHLKSENDLPDYPNSIKNSRGMLHAPARAFILNFCKVNLWVETGHLIEKYGISKYSANAILQQSRIENKTFNPSVAIIGSKTEPYYNKRQWKEFVEGIEYRPEELHGEEKAIFEGRIVAFTKEQLRLKL